MSRVISQVTDDRNEIDHAIDRYFAAKRNLADAECNLAKVIAHTWLESQANATRAPIVTPAQQHEPLMTVEEVAQYLRMKEATIYTWARDGRIPCERPNGELRFRRSKIDQWMKTDSKDKIEKSPHTNDTVVNSPRSFLRPQNRSKSNGRV